MSKFVKGTLVEAILGAVLITLLLLPFQILLPQYAPYTPFLIVPIIVFFALQLPLGGLIPMVLSFLAGVAWGLLFAVVAGPMLASNPASAPLVLGVGITVVIFLILAVHPTVLGKTPLAMVPVVLLGFVESLMVMMFLSQIGDNPGAPAALVPPRRAPGDRRLLRLRRRHDRRHGDREREGGRRSRRAGLEPTSQCPTAAGTGGRQSLT